MCERCLAGPRPLEAEFCCASCRAPFTSRYPLDETGRCALCRLGLNGFDAVYSYGWYEGSLRALIHVLKYEGVRPLARPLGQLLLGAIPRQENFDAIVPMPLHWSKLWQRGFNQAELLARQVARARNTPLVKAVKRRKATAPQAGLTNARRRANVQGAFQATRRLDGMRVLLIDDVLTTGATASACARALKRAGAAHVALAAVARTDRRLRVEVQA